MPRFALSLVLLVSLLVWQSPRIAWSHEGHDHGPAPAPLAKKVAPRAETSSEAFEIVAVARGGDLVVYLDRFTSNEPVEGASIEIDSPAGILKPVEKGSGVYAVAAPFVAAPGSYDLAFTVSADGAVDLLAATLKIDADAIAPANTASSGGLITPAMAEGVGKQAAGLDLAILASIGFGILIGAASVLWVKRGRGVATVIVLAVLATVSASDHAAAEQAAVPVADLAQRSADGSVFVSKPTQRLLAVRTEMTALKANARAVELPGRIIADPNASGLVQAPVGGRLAPPEGGFKPLGRPVRAGDVLAYIHPPLPSADATVQAQQARELEQQMSIVRRRIERYTPLAQSGATPRSQLEDAQLELKGLMERRANLDRVKERLEPLVAPVAGIIASSNAVAGQMAEPNAIIFQIIDPTRLWVEALSFEPKSLTESATARLSDGRTLDLDYLGTGLADKNQSVPVQFAVRGDTSGLRPGQFLSVFATTTDEKRGITVARTSVVRGSNGQSVVYEHTAAERFVPREVRFDALDSERVLVTAGLEAGKRVVTQGAELLNQIR